MSELSKSTYELVEDGWVDGVWVPKGTKRDLTKAEAKYLELGGSIAPAKPATKPRARRKRDA